MEYLIRLIQIHETFRKPELEALAEIANIKMEILFYSADVGPNFVQSCYQGLAVNPSSEFKSFSPKLNRLLFIQKSNSPN